MAQTALRQRQIRMTEGFAVAARSRDRIHPDEAAGFQARDADQRDRRKIFRIVAERGGQDLRRFRRPLVARQIHHKADDTGNIQPGGFQAGR